jgi:hypothetical protein
MSDIERRNQAAAPTPSPGASKPAPAKPKPVEEIGGPKGPEPTRYGDWEVGGRCTDF